MTIKMEPQAELWIVRIGHTEMKALMLMTSLNLADRLRALGCEFPKDCVVIAKQYSTLTHAGTFVLTQAGTLC